MASGCSTIGNSETDASALPPAPPVIELTEPLQFLPTDGLHRLVVTPPPTEAQPTADSGSSAAADPATATASGASSPGSVETAEPGSDGETAGPTDLPPEGGFDKIDPIKLAQLTGDTEIVFQGPTPGYLDADGEFVSLAADATPPSTEAAPKSDDEDTANEDATDADTDEPAHQSVATRPDPAEHPAIKQLRTLDDVVSVVAIGDGSYAITSSDPNIIDQLDPELRSALAVAPDAPLALSNDPYQPYQWALDNTGTNLATIQNPPPAQIADADIDGLEAAAGPRGL